jgi:hypothetical protein
MAASYLQECSVGSIWVILKEDLSKVAEEYPMLGDVTRERLVKTVLWESVSVC